MTDIAVPAGLFHQRQAWLQQRLTRFHVRPSRINRSMVQAEEYELHQEMLAPLRRDLAKPLFEYVTHKTWRASVLELIAETEAMLTGNARRAPYSAWRGGASCPQPRHVGAARPSFSARCHTGSIGSGIEPAF
jgi:hypothetical protein